MALVSKNARNLDWKQQPMCRPLAIAGQGFWARNIGYLGRKPKGGCVHERTPPICLAAHVHREGFLQLRTSRYDPSDHQLELLGMGIAWLQTNPSNWN